MRKGPSLFCVFALHVIEPSTFAGFENEREFQKREPSVRNEEAVTEQTHERQKCQGVHLANR